MAERIANPYASPLAPALSNLAKAFVSGPTEAEKIVQAENALKLQRQRQGVTDLASAFQSFGQPAFDRNAAMSSAILGGYKPEDLAVLERYGSANTFGVNDPRTSAAFVGAGGAYGSSPQGFRENEANTTGRARMALDQQRYQFDNTPQVIGSDKGPVIVPRSQSYGQPAVEDLGKVKGNAARVAINAPGGLAAADPATQRFIGVTSNGQSTPRNYVANGRNFITYDGTTDANTGQPLPAGGFIANAQGAATDVGLRPATRGGLEEASIAQQKFKGLLDHTRMLAQKNAANFGVSGFVKGVAQDAAQIAGNLAQGLGYTGAQDAVANIQREAVANGVDPSMLPGLFNFDPDLPSLHTASDLLVYSAASALADQRGRGVSDRDVALFRNIVGDPRDWTGNQEKFLAKLDTLEQILSLNKNVVDQNLRGGAATAAPAPAAPGAGAPPPASGAPPIVEEWIRGPDGTLQRGR